MERALADQAGGRGVPERGGAAVAERDLVAVGRGEELGEPERTRPTRSLTGGWRCEVPIHRSPDASAASASGRTLEGPQPKRPSPGFRSVGISTVVGALVVIWSEAIERGRAARARRPGAALRR